ncbi:PX domain-containing protein kinase-like protein [Chironomus tepperi]|uniref:PX domain-containing protein kinase-like protein n=1 Tax=Chironomus tepperi TaxID=113505 RepID=UPI00391FC557
MMDGMDLFWIIIGVSACVIVFLCCCFGCIVAIAAVCSDDDEKDENNKTEETTEKTTKTVAFQSTEVGWSVPNQSSVMYPPASSGPPYPPQSATPYPPPYPTLNSPQASYPAGNSRTPSPQPYLPYPVNNVNEMRG